MHLEEEEEKFTSEFIDMDKADHNDLRVMFDEINE